MDWQNILTQVILYAVGLILSGVGALAMYYIKNKIKYEKARTLVEGAFNVVTNGVNYIYQTYVSNLKGTDLWDKDAQANAKAQAKEYIEKNLNDDVKKYLKDNNKDIQEWIEEQIEIAISKNK